MSEMTKTRSRRILRSLNQNVIEAFAKADPSAQESEHAMSDDTQLNNPDYSGAGCRRCRMDRIRFIKPVKLPRFSFEAGEHWHVPQSRYRDGGVDAGGGWIPGECFVIADVDYTRACHNGSVCPGDAP